VEGGVGAAEGAAMDAAEVPATAADAAEERGTAAGAATCPVVAGLRGAAV
jgi:hypothetical protein